MLQQIILSQIVDLVDEFIVDNNISSTADLNSDTLDDRLVAWMNNHIDIPFLSEDAEEDIIRLVVTLVKGVILGKLN